MVFQSASEKIEPKMQQENKKVNCVIKIKRDLAQIDHWIRKSPEDYDDWYYDEEEEKLEIYVGDDTEYYTRQDLIEGGILFD